MQHWSPESQTARDRTALRRANERQLERLADAGKLDADAHFVCECGAPGCNRRMRLNGHEFRRLLLRPASSVLVPGHQRAGDRVVVRRRHYAVVVSGGGGGVFRLSEAKF